jgi:hypothetical protein
MVSGTWKIQIIDEKTQILADTYTTTFTKGTTSLPVTILQGAGTGGKSYRADCSVSSGTCGGSGGCPPQYNTSPCNRSYSTFSGSNYLTFPDDPTLKYTGDLSIAVSIWRRNLAYAFIRRLPSTVNCVWPPSAPALSQWAQG